MRPQLGCLLGAGTPGAPRAGGGESSGAAAAAESRSRRSCSRESLFRCPVCGESVPTRFGCFAPVFSRRLRSEAALSALRSRAGDGRGGAGLTAAAPGERLPTNEGERGHAATAPARPHITYGQRDTQREGGRKNRVTERLTGKETVTDL